MTARPTESPDYATDANYPADAGPDASAPTKIAIPAGMQAMGHRREQPVLAQYDNWFLNLLGRWINYLDTNKVDQTTRGIVAYNGVSVINQWDALPPVSGWQQSIGADNYWVTTNTTGAVIYWPIRVPHGATITRIETFVQAATGHGALPANKPNMKLVKNSIALGATNIANVTDPSATVVQYEDTAHSMAATGLAEVVDTVNNFYFLVITPETGANALAGAAFHPRIYWSIATLTPWAQ